MIGSDLIALKVEKGYTSNEALRRALGLGKATFYKYISTQRKELPLTVALAAAAVAADLLPYQPSKETKQKSRIAQKIKSQRQSKCALRIAKDNNS